MLNYGWVCPKCGRVYAPNQEMCLYCGPNEKTQTINNLGDWISTNPCIVDTQKGPTNIRETSGTPGSPFYTTTTITGSIGYEGPVQEVVLDTQRVESTPCSSNGEAISGINASNNDTVEINGLELKGLIENSVKEKLDETTMRAPTD